MCIRDSVKAEHYPVFDCAVGERAIHYGGHVKMMGATQPFISGAISKTVNLPETATVDEVAQLWIDAWKLGVKAVSYTHLRAHETPEHLVCRLLLEKKKK